MFKNEFKVGGTARGYLARANLALRVKLFRTGETTTLK